MTPPCRSIVNNSDTEEEDQVISEDEEQMVTDDEEQIIPEDHESRINDNSENDIHSMQSIYLCNCIQILSMYLL